MAPKKKLFFLFQHLFVKKAPRWKPAAIPGIWR